MWACSEDTSKALVKKKAGRQSTNCGQISQIGMSSLVLAGLEVKTMKMQIILDSHQREMESQDSGPDYSSSFEPKSFCRLLRLLYFRCVQEAREAKFTPPPTPPTVLKVGLQQMGESHFQCLFLHLISILAAYQHEKGFSHQSIVFKFCVGKYDTVFILCILEFVLQTQKGFSQDGENTPLIVPFNILLFPFLCLYIFYFFGLYSGVQYDINFQLFRKCFFLLF